MAYRRFKDLGAAVRGLQRELCAAGGLGAEWISNASRATGSAAAVLAIGETQSACAGSSAAFTPRLLEIYNEEFGLPRVARGAAAVVGRSSRAIATWRAIAGIVMTSTWNF